MSDLIDREALLDGLKEAYAELKKIYDGLQYVDERRICGAQLSTFAETVLRVKKAPAVDAVEVVRCKDCKMYCPESVVVPAYCTISGNQKEDDDFCSWGESIEER